MIHCLFLFLSCGDKQEKIFPTKIHLTESVYASVTVQPDSLYQAYAPVAGILDRNLLEEGELVSKGTPITQIVNSTPKLNTENARLALQLAQENYNGSSAVLGSLEDEIQSATLSFKNDSMNFIRQKRLWDQNIGSKVQFENRKLAYEISGNNLKQLKNIVKLQLGQKALITLDAYGNEVFDAKVNKIYPKKDERSQTFKAEAIFSNPPQALYPGLAGEGNIIISEKESVLTIPKEFLLEGNKVRTPDGLVEVVPGLQNLERVEIINGINETTEILKPEE